MTNWWQRFRAAFIDGWNETRSRWGDKRYVSLACNAKRHQDCNCCECVCHKPKRMMGHDD